MKNWNDVNPNIPAIEALKQCLDENIMASSGRMQVGQVTYAVNGTRYFGYRDVTWDEIVKRKPIVQWFEGLQVTWTDVYMDPIMNRGPASIEKLSKEDRLKMYVYFADERRLSGSWNEVRAICSKEGMEYAKQRQR